ncbi:hypothetical protein WBP06_09580 [Novosphingobium sp. BL-8H]|uniref:hypothetical protein n=1 Tax=Novosphingobium sp. BL-8H TaxID=3127640 RepID=UPI003756C958
MTMPETTQCDLVERLTKPHASLATQSFMMHEAAAEITRLRAHCEAMAKALDVAERQITAACQTIYPGDNGILDGSLENVRTPLKAYREEKGT